MASDYVLEALEKNSLESRLVDHMERMTDTVAQLSDLVLQLNNRVEQLEHVVTTLTNEKGENVL